MNVVKKMMFGGGRFVKRSLQVGVDNAIAEFSTRHVPMPQKVPCQMEILKFGEKNKDKIFAVIKLFPDWIPTAGFFAIFNRVLNGLYFADRFNFIPFVDNWNGCAYEEKEAVNGAYNVFEYYFEPVSKYSIAEIMQSQNVCLMTDLNADLILHTCGVAKWYSPTDLYIAEMARVFRTYIKFNKTTKEMLSCDIASLDFRGNTLGVHYRGSDYKLGIKNHPGAYSLAHFEYEIRDMMRKMHFDSIFLATDDTEALEYFKRKFTNLKYYANTKRSDSKVSVAFLKDERKNGNYLKGYEVLRDMYTLGCCQGLLAGQSQVSLTAKVCRLASGTPYILDRCIETVVNATGIDWMQYFEEMKGKGEENENEEQ